MADRDVTNPGDSDVISGYPANERAQRAAQTSIFDVDHFDPDTADQGRHRVVRLKEFGADPAAISNYGLVYTKDVGGVTELFVRDSDGNVLQLTNEGKINNTVVNMPEQAADPATPVASGNLYTKVFNGNAELFWQDELANVVRLTFQGELVVNLQTTDVVVGSLRTNNFFRGRRRDLTIVANALEIDLETGTVFAFTVDQNVTVTLVNMPDVVDGEEQTILLDVLNGGAFTTALASAFTLERPGGVVVPLTVAGRDLIVVSTFDGVTILTDTILDFK